MKEVHWEDKKQSCIDEGMFKKLWLRFRVFDQNWLGFCSNTQFHSILSPSNSFFNIHEAIVENITF